MHLWITVIYTRLRFGHDFRFWHRMDSHSLNHGTIAPSAIKVFITSTKLSSTSATQYFSLKDHIIIIEHYSSLKLHTYLF